MRSYVFRCSYPEKIPHSFLNPSDASRWQGKIWFHNPVRRSRFVCLKRGLLNSWSYWDIHSSWYGITIVQKQGSLQQWLKDKYLLDMDFASKQNSYNLKTDWCGQSSSNGDQRRTLSIIEFKNLLHPSWFNRVKLELVGSLLTKQKHALIDRWTKKLRLSWWFNASRPLCYKKQHSRDVDRYEVLTRGFAAGSWCFWYRNRWPVLDAPKLANILSYPCAIVACLTSGSEQRLP